ncbi:MAG TPA: YggS family pyridoxal phosphate-dependent enzyme, partial [Bdellovibrionota bacterium]|nr:YggS family pyridoxal phosphate-dependent enzyme [Bdellovibrionota bacterium]
FGENRLQELLGKDPLLPKDIEWHFIGRLQRRKVAKVLPMVSLIHSLDSLELAQEIEKRASALSRTARCLIEVNVDREPQKGGIDPENLMEFLREINKFSSLIPVGLMCIPREGGRRVPFKALKQLGEKFRKYFSFSTVELSMGMSEDFEIAIEEGSTIVRIGEGLFGPRV